MSTKTTVVTSSTNIASGTTTATTTTVPDWVMGLPREQRDKTASQFIVQDRQDLRNVENQIPDAVSPLLDGQKESSYIKDGSVVNVFNISGPNARVYISSKDSSINIENITPEEVFNELRNLIAQKITNVDEQSALLLKVDQLAETKGSTAFKEKYSEFIALAANHMSLVGPIIPALTQWLCS